MVEVFNQRWWNSPNIGFPLGFIDDRRRAEAGRLVSVLYGPGETPTDSIERLRRAAALLELSALAGNWGVQSPQVWETIALIHQAIGTLSPDSQGGEWLLSALAWQLAGLPSIAALLASRLRNRATYATSDVLEKMAILFSQRDFAALGLMAATVVVDGSELRAEVGKTGDWDSAALSVLLLSSGDVMRRLARYAEYGEEALPALEPLDDYLATALVSGDSRAYRLGRLLSESVRRFCAASSRMSIDQLPNLSQRSRVRLHGYLRMYPELWPSQQHAIEHGLLDPTQQHFVVAVPTSSGKTLCGELAIIQELSDKPQATCFYVVPTRALVTEKSDELRSKLRRYKWRVAAATGALQQDEIEGALLASARVVVCTPEKLDLLLRHEDESLDHAALFVIDETHMIADLDRGLGLEFVVIKLLLLRPNARVLLLSAMLPNSEQFGRWLSGNAVVSASEWRPTRQQFGEITFDSTKPRGCNMKVTLYDSSGQLEGLQIHIHRYSRKPNSLLEMVMRAVEAFRAKGPVLVFCMSKARCEEIVQGIVDSRAENVGALQTPAAVERLRRKIRREVAEGFLLERSLALGVAYHHADLPPRIRVDLERLIAEGQVDIVVCTTTLAEGVNLPISTVIFESWLTRGDAREGRKPEPLDLSKFRNIAGRAGRAGKETEGLILFLQPDHMPIPISEEKLLTPRQYFLRDIYPPIESRFLDIVTRYSLPSDEDLDRAWEQGDTIWRTEVRRALRQFGSAVLHAIEVLNLNDTEITERVVQHSLLAIQAPERREAAKAWLASWIRLYHRVNIVPEELRPIAMQVGLPLRAVQGLYGRASSTDELRELFGTNASDFALTDEQITVITDMVTHIQELDWGPENAPHSRLLAGWMRGTTITGLAADYVPHLTQQNRPIERTCSYTMQQLSNGGAWGMYALARVMELVFGPTDNLSPIVKRLPLLAYFGVDTVPAALFSLMGVERIDALRLGRAFLARGHTLASVTAIRAWAAATGREGLASILRGMDDRDLDDEVYDLLGVEG